jgi:hypothetical protein
MSTISDQELADLLMVVGQAHHEAYRESDGFDPEWASWYAPYLQTRIGDRLGRKVTRSELTYLLLKAQREHDSAADGSPWPPYYAGVIRAG